MFPVSLNRPTTRCLVIELEPKGLRLTFPFSFAFRSERRSDEMPTSPGTGASWQLSRSLSCTDDGNCGCETITRVVETKYLGVLLDEKLSWKPHIGHLLARLRNAMAVISRLRRAAGVKTAVAAYKALVESHIRYCILSYMSTYQISIEQIEKATECSSEKDYECWRP